MCRLLPVWLWRPCAVGVHKSTGDNQYDHQTQDGSSSSLIIFLILLALGISLSISPWISGEQTIPIERIYADLSMTLFMVSSCALMISFCTCRFKETRRKNDGAPHKGIQQFFFNHLVVIGLIVFYIPGVFLDSFELMAQIDCFESFRKCDRSLVYGVRITFLVTRIIFKTILLIFSYLFDLRVFRQSKFVRYALTFILLSVLLNWFDYEVYDIEHALGSITSDRGDQCDMKNKTIKEVQCVSQNTSLYDLYESSRSILFPLDTEFALLAAKIVIHMLYFVKNFQVQTDPENAPLLGEEREEQNQLSSATPNLSLSSNGEHDRSPTAKIPYLTCLAGVLSLALLVLGVLTLKNHTEPHLYFRLFVWLIMVVVIAAGFKILNKNFVSSYKPTSGHEVVTIVSILGAAIHLWFNLYPVLACFFDTAPRDNPQLTCTNDTDGDFGLDVHVGIPDITLNFIEIFYQATFMLLVARLVPQIPQDPEQRKFVKQKLWLLRQCEMFLAITNYVWWIQDSFIETKAHGIHAIQAFYYGESSHWPVMLHLTIPFFLFFRFNSGLIFTQLFLKHSG